MKQYKIAVVSDIHYMARTLLNADAQNFEPFITDRTHKAMLEWSADIFDQVISELKSEAPDILLIPGDLTKDGEVISHSEVQAKLHDLVSYVAKNKGKKLQVYVVPGNSDIDNPEACEYHHNRMGFKTEVPNISKTDFKNIYLTEKTTILQYALRPDIIGNDFTNSLSYVAEPFGDRLWILAIDALDYTNLQKGQGKLLIKDAAGNLVNTPTMNWIETVMQNAVAKNVTVLGLMHYNIIQHFKDQPQSPLKGNLLQYWNETANKLANLGLRIMFTGRHATDITCQSFGAVNLYDIQTGSLVTPPSLYRIINLKLNGPAIGGTAALDIFTKLIQTISPTIPFPNNIIDPQTGIPKPNPSFVEFSKFRLAQCVDKVLTYPEYRNAFMAHVAGNENFGPAQQTEYNNLKAKMTKNLNDTLAAVVNVQTDINTIDDNPPTIII